MTASHPDPHTLPDGTAISLDFGRVPERAQPAVGGLDLGVVRSRIDELDARIVGLIAERQRWVETAGRLKADEGAVRAPSRVEQVIAKVQAFADGAGASPDVVERTYRAMIAAFIDLELKTHREA